MRILFVGLNYAPEPVGIGLYSGEMAQDWAARGHEVRAIVAHPYYPNWRTFAGYGHGWTRAREQGVDVTRVPIYVPRRPSFGRRLRHYASFAASACGPALRAAVSAQAPDLVFTVAPALVSAPLALLASRVAGAQSWLHVQDFEIEAACSTSLVGEDSLLVRGALMMERQLFKGFDAVSTISPQMLARLAQKGVDKDKLYELRNWANIPSAPPSRGAQAIRADLDIQTRHVALYSGSIAQKQGIEIIADVAERLRHREDLTFVICGEGPQRALLQERARDLPSLKVFGLQPKERLAELLEMASLHLMPQRSAASDLMLPSKLTNMLASGRPIVATAEAGSGLAMEVDGCGIITKPECAIGMAGAIERLLDNPDEWRIMGQAARLRAIERWSKPMILDRLNQAMENLVAMRRPAQVGTAREARP